MQILELTLELHSKQQFSENHTLHYTITYCTILNRNSTSSSPLGGLSALKFGSYLTALPPPKFGNPSFSLLHPLAYILKSSWDRLCSSNKYMSNLSFNCFLKHFECFIMYHNSYLIQNSRGVNLLWGFLGTGVILGAFWKTFWKTPQNGFKMVYQFP